MQTIVFKWEKYDPDDPKDGYLYAFVLGRNVLYIGQSYNQPLYERIKQSLTERELKGKPGLRVYAAQVDYNSRYKDAIKRITSNLVDDAEKLLIYALQPSRNTQHRKSYKGRQPLRLISTGCSALPKEVYIVDDEVKVK